MSRSSTMDTEWRRLERIMWVIVGLLATKNCVCVYSGLIISVLLASSYYIIIIISTSSSSSYLLFLTSMILRGARLESQACVNADTAPPPIVLPYPFIISGGSAGQGLVEPSFPSPQTSSWLRNKVDHFFLAFA